MTKVSSTYLFHRLGGCGAVSRASFSKFSMKMSATMGPLLPLPFVDNTAPGHTTTLNKFSIVDREEQNLSRLIKESMFIRVNNPSLNRNIGKYHLPHIWDEVLINNIELKLK